ncbi:MAG: hypothetical protein AAFQ62_01120 [Pseudomonadota bacterium]
MGNLAVFGFWMFIAAVSVAGIWYDAKEKETKQETLRRVVESGRDVDPEMIRQIVGENSGGNTARDLRIGAYILFGVAPGMFLFSIFIGMVNEEGRTVLMGVSALIACIGGGLLGAARLVERNQAEA